MFFLLDFRFSDSFANNPIVILLELVNIFLITSSEYSFINSDEFVSKNSIGSSVSRLIVSVVYTLNIILSSYRKVKDFVYFSFSVFT